VRLSRGKPSIFAKPWQQSRRLVLLALVALSVASFVTQLFLDAYQPEFVREFLALSDRGLHAAYAWQFVTAPLLFGNPWHFFASAVVLYILGRDLESILGQRHFFYLFLSGAIGGELGHLFLMPSETILYAASGGVAAVLIAYATILPELDLITWRVFRFSFHLKAKHAAVAISLLSLVMLLIDRHGAVVHSAIPGGLAAGWLYSNLLGFGHASWLRRFSQRRRDAAERVQRMSREEFIELEINPVLEKISRKGIQSLNRAERRALAQASEKVG